MDLKQDNGSSSLSITLELSPTSVLSILQASSQPSSSFITQQHCSYQVWRTAHSVPNLAKAGVIDLTAGSDIVVWPNVKRGKSRRKRQKKGKLGRRI